MMLTNEFGAEVERLRADNRRLSDELSAARMREALARHAAFMEFARHCGAVESDRRGSVREAVAEERYGEAATLHAEAVLAATFAKDARTMAHAEEREGGGVAR